MFKREKYNFRRFYMIYIIQINYFVNNCQKFQEFNNTA